MTDEQKASWAAAIRPADVILFLTLAFNFGIGWARLSQVEDWIEKHEAAVQRAAEEHSEAYRKQEERLKEFERRDVSDAKLDAILQRLISMENRINEAGGRRAKSPD
jgi:hypothetical protein